MSHRFPGAIFDVDGVLLASPHEPAWRDSLQILMTTDWRDIAPETSYAPERFTSALYQEKIAGKPRLSGARAALEYFGVPDVAERSLAYAQHKQERLLQLIAAGEFQAFPDGVRLALALKARGVRLAAASSSKNATELMAKVSLDAYVAPYVAPDQGAGPPRTLLDLFDADLSGRDVPEGKPHPAIFLLAAEALQLPPALCFVVEDAPAGIQAAKAGHMLAIGVARADDQALLEHAGADIVVPTLDDVDADRLLDGSLTSSAREMPTPSAGATG